MPEVIKTGEVKDRAQPVPLEEVPQLKHVGIRLQLNSCCKKGGIILAPPFLD
jgi:hypothetical protein